MDKTYEHPVLECFYIVLWYFIKQPQENMVAHWLVNNHVFRNTELAWAVDIHVTIVQTKNWHFDNQSKQVVFLCFLREIENMFCVFVSKYMHLWTFGITWESCENTCLQLLFPQHLWNLHSCFYNLVETWYMFSIS